MFYKITATGTNQSTAAPLNGTGPLVAYDVLVPTAGLGVVLPTYSDLPAVCVVRNNNTAGANALKIYGAGSETVGGSASYSLASGAVVQLWAITPTEWLASLLV